MNVVIAGLIIGFILYSFASSYSTIIKIKRLVLQEESILSGSDKVLSIFQMSGYAVKDSTSIMCIPICGINKGAIYVNWKWKFIFDEREIEQSNSCFVIITRNGFKWEPTYIIIDP